MEFKKNDVLTVTIEDMGTNGEGIGKIEGYALFVKDAIIGDVVEAKLMKLKKNYAYARLIKLINPSPYRVEPKCPVCRQCGGCQIQPLSYEEQLNFKQKKVQNNLERIGGFANLSMEPILAMEEPYHYRNKAQFPVGTDKNGEIVTGFYAGRTHDIIPNVKCYLGAVENEKILQIVLDFMKKYHITSYNEATGKGLVRHVLIRKGFASGELMVCLILNGRKLPHGEALVKELSKMDGMTSITLNVNEKKTNVILGTEVLPLWGQTCIQDKIGNITYRISPLSFYQVNPVQTKRLYETALEYAGLHGEETVWDLYCGIGTISLFLAQKAKQVYGVEIVPEAIEDARVNAELNGMTNVEFYVGKAEEVLPELYRKEGISADVIVVDPPRKGCDEKCLDTIVKMQPDRVVYVSCDSATLARDLRYLCDRGFRVERVRGCDMFPQTAHVETVCLLSKLHADQHIEVELQMDELDLTAAESKATYEEIKDYVLEHTGLKVSNLYIAQIKQKCGIIERANYNLPKSENSRQPKCPPEKEKVIREALEHFRMI
ncbi:MAG: 23S rRNA (uracil(1939)-C(5))-methyltransferase RlmD [Lachnospiraceae bacterium]|nr:23S rRNA (uracil(1939)-C(5))-methyltransferase RlmD [Lachnospiraceae bacterium]